MDFLAIRNAPDQIAARTAAIAAALMARSLRVKEPNFKLIGNDDLSRLFDLYDRDFFDGQLALQVKTKTTTPLQFAISTRMTSAGGKTIVQRQPGADGTQRFHYQIAIAGRLLFMTFGGVDRPVIVNGFTCTDRLSALQRIMEHEIIHLLELTTFGDSSCGARRFKVLAANIFGHTGTKHALVTPREHAAVRHGITLGSMVTFEFEGRKLVGRVNRIHRRATVLVEDSDGVRYTDGKWYRKYYIPLAFLGIA